MVKFKLAVLLSLEPEAALLRGLHLPPTWPSQEHTNIEHPFQYLYRVVAAQPCQEPPHGVLVPYS